MIPIRNIISLIVSVLLIESCSQKEASVPKEILSPDSMVSILVDVHLAEASSNLTRINDPVKIMAYDLYPLIFKTHHTDSATFRQSFDWYLDHPKRLDKVYEQVINELSRRESEPNRK